MRVLASIVFMLVLGACQTNSNRRSESNALRPAQALAPEQKEVAGEIPVQFLLTAAATDFHSQHRSHTLEFRNVQIGHEMNPAGKMQYILCGQFLPRPKEQADWTPFATIKTSGYEQWLGAQAASFCQQPSIVWSKEEWSSSLQRRFDSL